MPSQSQRRGGSRRRGRQLSDGIDNSALEDGADGADAVAPDWIPNGPDDECAGLLDLQEGGMGPKSCFDCIDNDEDDVLDARDPDCAGLPLEDDPDLTQVVVPIEIGCSCWDGIDNTGDGAMDTDDEDCIPVPPMAALPTEDGAGFGSCWDGIDNGSDGFDGTDLNCTFAGAGQALGAPAKAMIVWNDRPSTLMHELGHLLGLHHGGPAVINGQDVPANRESCKPPHVSVMNAHHTGGIQQAVRLDAVEGEGTCSDGEDNDGDGLTDHEDEDCRLGSDLTGDGVPETQILDYAPPRFIVNGVTVGRGRDLTPVEDIAGNVVAGVRLDEQQLDERMVFDPTDAYNLARLGRTDDRGRIEVRMDGFDWEASEDAMSGGPMVVGQCHDFEAPNPGDPLEPEDNDDNTPEDPNELDPDCFGSDWNGDFNLTGVVEANINVGCFDTDTTDTIDGVNDWAGLGLPVPGLSLLPVPVENEPPLTELTVDEEIEANKRADMEVRFLRSAVLANVGDVAFATAQIRNRGPAAALGVEVVVTATPGVELLGAPSTCSLEGNVATCPLGAVGDGVVGFLDLSFQAVSVPSGDPPPLRQIIATVFAPGDRDPDLRNNTDAVTLVSCELSSHEAESMEHDGGSPFPGGWKLSSSGSVAASHGFTGQPTAITVKAKGQKAGFHWPKMTVTVDGKAIGTQVVSSSFYQDYVFETSTPAGAREIRIHFDNPSPYEDRVLFLNRVKVRCTPSCSDGLLNQGESDTDCGGGCGPTCADGDSCMDDNDCSGGFCDGAVCTTVSCEDGIENGHEEGVDCGGFCPIPCSSCGAPSTYEAETMFHSTGGSDPEGWVLWDNGYISATHAFVAGDVAVTVVAKGDSALGIWPHMVVSVDGAVVGDALVTSDDWAPYNFQFEASAGPQELRVEFDNDYYDPPGHDRNLYVDHVTIACAPTCDDDLTNGTETDTDCGGGACSTCPDGSSCAVNADCESENCSGAVCEAGHYLYNFESGTANWTQVEASATCTTTSTLHAFDGAKSLKVNVSGSGDPRVWTSPPEPVPSGAPVTFHLYIPTSAPVTAVQPYVADAAWQWSQSWYAITGAMKGSWQTLEVTVDPSAETPVQELGIKAYLSGSYTGPLYIDGVEW